MATLALHVVIIRWKARGLPVHGLCMDRLRDAPPVAGSGMMRHPGRTRIAGTFALLERRVTMMNVTATTRLRALLASSALLAAALVLAPRPAAAQGQAAQRALPDFFGEYVGEALSSDATDLSRRDIAVRIDAHGAQGFTLTWTTVIRQPQGDARRKTHTVDFVPTGDAQVYASAMRTNLFGKAVPLDPLQGDPYVWATLQGATLTVHALVITQDHGYEMQTYKRTLTPAGLDLVFHRVRDGQRLRDITGSLVRIDG